MYDICCQDARHTFVGGPENTLVECYAWRSSRGVGFAMHTREEAPTGAKGSIQELGSWILTALAELFLDKWAVLQVRLIGHRRGRRGLESPSFSLSLLCPSVSNTVVPGGICTLRLSGSFFAQLEM